MLNEILSQTHKNLSLPSRLCCQQFAAFGSQLQKNEILAFNERMA